MSPSIAVIARFMPRPGSRAALRDMLETMLTPTRAEEGCRTYDLYESADDSGFVLFERYRSRGALDAHRASPHYVDYRAKVTELLAQPIKVDVLFAIDEAADYERGSGYSSDRLTTMASWLVRAITTSAGVLASGFSSRCGTYGGTKM